MSKHWEFNHSPIPDGKPKTLADVPEGVLCVVTYNGGEMLLLRQRIGNDGCGQEGSVIGAAVDYKFISYIDGHRPPEQPPKQWTFASVPVGRCFKLKGHGFPYVYWKKNELKWTRYKSGDGKISDCSIFDDNTSVVLLPIIAELVDDPTGDTE